MYIVVIINQQGKTVKVESSKKLRGLLFTMSDGEYLNILTDIKDFIKRKLHGFDYCGTYKSRWFYDYEVWVNKGARKGLNDEIEELKRGLNPGFLNELRRITKRVPSVKNVLSDIDGLPF